MVKYQDQPGDAFARMETSPLMGTAPTGPESEQLVNRERQLEAFQSALSRIKAQKTQAGAFLMEWYGGPGIGKSKLIELLVGDCQAQGIPFANVNFLALEQRTESYIQDPFLLLDQIVTDLQTNGVAGSADVLLKTERYRTLDRPRNVVREYNQWQRANTPMPAWVRAMREVVEALAEAIVQYAQPVSKADITRPVALFFDESEAADIEFVDWLEEWVVNPLLQTKCCVIVWTARRPWRWNRPEVRRWLRSELLQPFNREEAKKQIELNSKLDDFEPGLADLLFQKAFEITRGHPYANRIVISQLKSWEGRGKEFTRQALEEQLPQLRSEIHSQFVLEYAMRGLPSDLRDACELLALPRFFETMMMRQILTACNPRLYPLELGSEEMRDLLDRLIDTQLLVWKEGKGHAVEPELRRLICDYFFEERRGWYILINSLALEGYKRLLAKDPIFRPGQFMLEEQYHLGCLRRAIQEEQAHVFEERLKELRRQIRDDELLTRELELLRGDLQRDDDLRPYTDAFIEHIRHSLL